jgi:hypothetical protein
MRRQARSLLVGVLVLVFVGLGPPVTSAHGDEDVEVDTAFRAALHFNADRQYVVRLRAAADTKYYGDTPFTVDEYHEVVERVSLERDAAILESLLSDDAIGGVFIDHSAGGKLVLLAVGQSCRPTSSSPCSIPIGWRSVPRLTHSPNSRTSPRKSSWLCEPRQMSRWAFMKSR